MPTPDDLLLARDAWTTDRASLASVSTERDALAAQATRDFTEIELLRAQVADLILEVARLQALLDAEEPDDPPPPPPPTGKSLIGVNTESAARFGASLKSAVGASAPPLNVERIFATTEKWGSGKWLDVVTAVKAGHTPIVSSKVSVSWSQLPTSAAEIARLDDVVNGLIALDISKLPLKPRLAIQHEPEKATGGTAADFNKMQKFLVTRYAAKLRAKGWDLCMIFMNGSFFVRSDGTTYTKWKRSDLETAIAGVDIKDVFVDLYEKPGGGEPWATADVGDPTSTKSTFRGYVDFCKAKGFNMGVCEFGINRKQSDNTGAQPAQFLDALAASPLFDDVLFWIYYDRDVGEGGATGNHRIDQFPLAMKSYAKLAG